MVPQGHPKSSLLVDLSWKERVQLYADKQSKTKRNTGLLPGSAFNKTVAEREMHMKHDKVLCMFLLTFLFLHRAQDTMVVYF